MNRTKDRHKVFFPRLIPLRLILGLILLTAVARPAAAQRLDPVGQLGGPCEAVAAQTGWTYAGEGCNVIRLDATDAAHPREAGRFTLPDVVQGLLPLDSLVAVADASGGLQIIDLTPYPAPAVRVAALDLGGLAAGLARAGNLLYITDLNGRLVIVDVTDRNHPAIRGTCPLPGQPRSVALLGEGALAGQRACVATWTAGLQIVDVSDPASPKVSGSLQAPDNAMAVAISDTLACVAAGSQGVQIVDLANPDAPVARGALQLTGWSSGVALSGKTAYVAAGQTLYSVDVTNPDQPTLAATLPTPGDSRAVAVAGSLAAIAEETRGVRLLGLGDPAAPATLGVWEMLTQAKGVALDRGLVYIDDTNNGLKVYDLSQPARPTLLGLQQNSEPLISLAVAGGLAIAGTVANYPVYDLTDPSTPRLTQKPASYGLVWDVAIQGTLAFGLAYEWGLQVFDLSDANAPKELSALSLIDTGQTMAGNRWLRLGPESRAYVLNDSGVQVIDVRQPAAPARLGTLPACNDLAFTAGGQAVVTSDNGLSIMDLVDLAAPRTLGSLVIAGGATSLAVDGQQAFVVTDQGTQLRAIDLSNPAAPTQLATYAFPGNSASNSHHLTASDGLIYDAEDSAGLLILRYTRGNAAREWAGYE